VAESVGYKCHEKFVVHMVLKDKHFGTYVPIFILTRGCYNLVYGTEHTPWLEYSRTARGSYSREGYSVFWRRFLFLPAK
jgi:hypothetical protein